MFCGWPTTEYRNVKNWVLKKGKSPDIFKCIQRHSSGTKGGKLVFERQPSQNFFFNWVLRARKGCQSSALDTKSNRKRIEKVIIQRNWVEHGVAPFWTFSMGLISSWMDALVLAKTVADIQTDNIPHCRDTAGIHLFIARRGKNTLPAHNKHQWLPGLA